MKSGKPSKPPRHDAEAGRQVELPIARPEGGGRRVAITGNRGITSEDREKIRVKVRELVANPRVAAIFFGGATGADTEALATALEARGEGGNRRTGNREQGTGQMGEGGDGARPRLIVIVPDTLEGQPRETWETSRRADDIVELGHPIRVEDRWRAYHVRNQRLVAEATDLVAFWNGDPRSGTAATIGLARKRGLGVEIVKVEGGD